MNTDAGVSSRRHNLSVFNPTVGYSGRHFQDMNEVHMRKHLWLVQHGNTLIIFSLINMK